MLLSSDTSVDVTPGAVGARTGVSAHIEFGMKLACREVAIHVRTIGFATWRTRPYMYQMATRSESTALRHAHDTPGSSCIQVSDGSVNQNRKAVHDRF